MEEMVVLAYHWRDGGSIGILVLSAELEEETRW